MAPSSATTPARRPGRAPVRASARVRRRRYGCAAGLLTTVGLLALLGLAILTGARSLADLGPALESGPDDITGIPVAEPVTWDVGQPDYGVDISFPQCGRVLQDMADGFAIVGLDGGMPDRPNPCFAEQWRFARAQSGAAVYVNTSDNGRGDPVALGQRNARADLEALSSRGIEPGTPIWLDVELTEVWQGSQARHRAVITEHLRVLADAGYPVGVYSAPALWQEITGGARLDVPVWVGIGRAGRASAEATCDRRAFGGQRPAIVQRIGTGSDGKPLDRNLVCPGVDLTGLVRPS
jgi:hypothetical protein